MADPVRDFALDDDGDMAFENGDRKLVAGAAAVQQGIKIRVRVYEGEIYADQGIGIPYIDQVLIKNPDPLVVRELIKDRIQSVPDVTDVVGAQLVVDRATREGSISFKYRSVYSVTPIQDTVEVPT